MFHALVFLPVILSIFGFLIHGHPVSNKVEPESEKETTPDGGVDNSEFVPENQN